ncbi:MAG TPA: TRAP transporter small permease [Casimicrobium sp.]|nr:TRAP transporter small permease [Casimicrobium sp.]
MRPLLNRLYDGAAALAAFFMVLLLIAVLLSVTSRVLGFNVPGIDMYAGYMMAGAGFLALAHTLKKGEHIRVTLVLQALSPRVRRWMELGSLVVAVVLAALLAWYSARLCFQSYQFNDISTGNDATPLWIPQLTMAAGTLILLVAFIDELVLEWTGKREQNTSAEALHNE